MYILNKKAMKKKYFSTIVCAFLSTLCFIFSSCSTDEENGGGLNGSLKVNGESYQVEDATISDGNSTEDVLVGNMFEAKIRNNDDFYFFTMEYIHWDNGHFSFELVEGDITDYISVETFSRSPVSLSSYEYISGKVFLTRDKNTVTLNFKDYTFKNDNDWKCVLMVQ